MSIFDNASELLASIQNGNDAAEADLRVTIRAYTQAREAASKEARRWETKMPFGTERHFEFQGATLEKFRESSINLVNMLMKYKYWEKMNSIMCQQILATGH